MTRIELYTHDIRGTKLLGSKLLSLSHRCTNLTGASSTGDASSILEVEVSSNDIQMEGAFSENPNSHLFGLLPCA